MNGDDECWWCGAEATLLCDALLGAERRKSDGTLILDEGYTCDAPMCRRCAKQIGQMCGARLDTIDVCPEHLMLNPLPLEKMAASNDEAYAMRRKVRVKAARARMRIVR